MPAAGTNVIGLGIDSENVFMRWISNIGTEGLAQQPMSRSHLMNVILLYSWPECLTAGLALA